MIWEPSEWEIGQIWGKLGKIDENPATDPQNCPLMHTTYFVPYLMAINGSI